MKKQRRLQKCTPEYPELNKLTKRKARQDIKKHNTERAYSVIENKNMDVLNSIKRNKRIRIHKLRNLVA